MLLEQCIEEYGAVLLRGLLIDDEAGFSNFVKEYSSTALSYVYRSTPRTSFGGGVYSATEYPPELPIPLHNENSYQRDWPTRILFFCMYPADGGGGETPLARTANVTRRISPAIRDRFLKRRVKYIRNYRAGLDLPWQTVFQTESQSEVEEYCRRNDIEFVWTGSNTLRTSQVCQSLAMHPHTRELLWFNQAHLFHVSSLDCDTREAMAEFLQPEELPRNATFGDGSPIPEDDLAAIRAAYEQEIVTFPWCGGDILIADNMSVAHGRMPYRGKRKVLVALCEPYSAHVGL